MTSLQVLLPGLPADPAAHRKATIRSVDGRLAMTIPIVDPETEFSELGQEWAVINRAPQIGVPYRRGPRLARMTLHMRFIARDRDLAVTNEVLALKALCDSLSAVVISYGTLEARMTRSGAWVIENGTVRELQRVQGSNDPRWAEADLELLEYASIDGRKFDVPLAILPASTSRVAAAGGARTTAAGDRVPATYTWRSGDSLFTVAQRIYGDSSYWTRIGDLNRIRDTRAIPVGTVLRLP